MEVRPIAWWNGNPKDWESCIPDCVKLAHEKENSSFADEYTIPLYAKEQ